MFITGEGVGATATALPDGDGFVTEIKVQSSGFGYKKNLASIMMLDASLMLLLFLIMDIQAHKNVC